MAMARALVSEARQVRGAVESNALCHKLHIMVERLRVAVEGARSRISIRQRAREQGVERELESRRAQQREAREARATTDAQIADLQAQLQAAQPPLPRYLSSPEGWRGVWIRL